VLDILKFIGQDSTKWKDYFREIYGEVHKIPESQLNAAVRLSERLIIYNAINP
jgi:hypothetical protein